MKFTHTNLLSQLFLIFLLAGSSKSISSQNDPYESIEDMLNFQVHRWEKNKGSLEIKMNFKSLEKQADTAYASHDYGKAWDFYGLAAAYYPSAQLFNKSGDAWMYAFSTKKNDSCYLGKQSYFAYQITRHYDLAIAFHGYNTEFDLSKADKKKVKNKSDCLKALIDDKRCVDRKAVQH